MKKLFALLAVATLAAIGCDNKATTGKPSSQTTGGVYEKKDTVRHDVTNTVTNTVVQHTAAETKTHTVAVTKTVDKPGPGLPDSKKGNGGK